MRSESSSVLAEASGALSDELRSALARLAQILQPEADLLEIRFLSRLERLSYDVRQRRALSCLTLGNAGRLLARGCPLSDFFEEVEYNGRRLAKLNLTPNAVTSALAEFEKLLKPVLRKVLGGESEQFLWVREQLQFCVMLTLNNAYYQVRETETQAFYEMFWAELKARSLDELLERFLAILARFGRADRACLYLHDPATQAFVPRACYGGVAGPGVPAAAQSRLARELAKPRCFNLGVTPGVRALDPLWSADFTTCWSIPLINSGSLIGVLQFAFLRAYDWLPREQELLTAAAERCTLAIEKAQMMESLAEQEAKIRSLAESMMHVEEAERRRVSRELHDQTGQDLLYIRLQMEMLENQLPEGEPHWRSRLGEIRDMTERTIIEIRRLIAALSPAVLEQLGLAAALRQLVTRFRTAHPAKVRLHLSRLGALPKQTEVITYRLVQECLNNIAKHSGCQTVTLSVSSADKRLMLEVEDDGIGFNPEEALNKPGSFGLAGIRERVALMGGSCEVTSRPKTANTSSGTRVRVELPVDGGYSRRTVNGQSGNAFRAELNRPKTRSRKTDKVLED